MVLARAMPICLGLALLSHGVRADVALFVPGFDPQPLSASELGTDASSHTTWQIVPGTVTDTDQDVGFIGTATLVEGPSDAHLLYQTAGLVLEVTCNIADNLANCTGLQGYDTTPMPLGTAGPFVVQGDAAAATPAASSPGTALSGSATQSASPGSSGASLPTNTGTPTATGAAHSPTTSTVNNSGSHTASLTWVIVAGGIIGALLL